MFNSFHLENHGAITGVMGVNTINAQDVKGNMNIGAGNPAEAVRQYKGRITDTIIGLDLPADVMITVLRAIHKERET